MVRLVFALVLSFALTATAAQQSHFFKDIVIDSGEVVEGDLSLYRGNLTVRGEITGNVAVMLGSCRIEPGGRIGGDLAVLQGDLVLNDPAEQVGGRISQRDFLAGALKESASPFEGPERTPQPEEREETATREKSTNLHEWESDSDTDLHLVFNRVSGLQLGLAFSPERARIQKDRWADIAGHLAWAFGPSRPEWKIKLRRQLPASGPFYLSAGAHRLTDTQDAWMLSVLENSLAGWLLHQDFFDYYDNRGGSVDLGGFFFDGRLQMQAGWFQERTGPLEVETQWSWSRADRRYRPNLYSSANGFEENRQEGLRASIDLELNRRVNGFKRGLALTLNYEKGFDGDPIKFDHDRLLGNLRFWLPIGVGRQFESLNGRVLAGRVTGEEIPLQYLFRLGGPDALPGWRPKAIDGRPSPGSEESLDLHLQRPDGSPVGGHNLLLGSLENRIRGSILDLWPLDEFDLLLMANAGTVFDGDWSDLKARDLQADFGFGIADSDDDWRLAILRATDRGDADWRLLFRLRPRF
jgi:hypothetical protein